MSAEETKRVLTMHTLEDMTPDAPPPSFWTRIHLKVNFFLMGILAADFSMLRNLNKILRDRKAKRAALGESS